MSKREIPNAEIEAGYRALVELGAPISRAEIVAVLEAAEGARGTIATDYAKKVLEDMRARLVWSADLAFRDRIDNAIRGLSLSHPEKEKA